MPLTPEPAHPRGRTGPQIHRMQRLIQWLRSDRKLTARLAADAFEVSPRTVANDILQLRTMGYPIEFDHRRSTYYLTDPVENLPVLPLRNTELAAFLVARHALEALGDAPHARLLADVVDKIAEHLPETIRVEPDALARLIRFDPGPQPVASVERLEALQQAVARRNVIRIRYTSNSTGEVTERDVEPYHLLCYQGRWYLIAYCRLRQAMRDFRIDRIAAASEQPETFTIPPDFDLDEYLGPAFGMTRGERTFAVHVRFTPYQARWIREERWHPSQVLVQLPDGSLDVRMQVAGLSDVARWVLSYGAECEVLSPPVLRHRVASEIRGLERIYSGNRQT